uniref:Uncharacterized protein n=1 Tax=Strongyloides papillosus TaxID=174720 RepID=A0A0N5CIX5_STREA
MRTFQVAAHNKIDVLDRVPQDELYAFFEGIKLRSSSNTCYCDSTMNAIDVPSTVTSNSHKTLEDLFDGYDNVSDKSSTNSLNQE